MVAAAVFAVAAATAASVTACCAAKSGVGVADALTTGDGAEDSDISGANVNPAATRRPTTTTLAAAVPSTFFLMHRSVDPTADIQRKSFLGDLRNGSRATR